MFGAEDKQIRSLDGLMANNGMHRVTVTAGTEGTAEAFIRKMVLANIGIGSGWLLKYLVFWQFLYGFCI